MDDVVLCGEDNAPFKLNVMDTKSGITMLTCRHWRSQPGECSRTLPSPRPWLDPTRLAPAGAAAGGSGLWTALGRPLPAAELGAAGAAAREAGVAAAVARPALGLGAAAAAVVRPDPASGAAAALPGGRPWPSPGTACCC